MISELIVRQVKKTGLGKIEQRGTALGSTSCAQVELPIGELSRSGRFFYGGLQLAANGIAPDATLPTTTAKLALFNNDDMLTFYVDHLHKFLVSGTPAAGSTLWVCVSRGPLATKPTADATGFGSSPSHGKPKVKSNAFWATAVTLPAGTIWHSVTSDFQLAVANIGQGDMPHEVRGGLAIPPGYAMGFAIFSAAGTTPLYGVSARWAELEGDLE